MGRDGGSGVTAPAVVERGEIAVVGVGWDKGEERTVAVIESMPGAQGREFEWVNSSVGG